MFIVSIVAQYSFGVVDVDRDVILDEPLFVEELEHLGKRRQDGLSGLAHQVGVLFAEYSRRLFQSAGMNSMSELGIISSFSI